MKVVILCGGKGTRLRVSGEMTPKSLAMVNGKPIIWHIMKLYSGYGYSDFILPLGFGGEQIKEYFYNYAWKGSDLIINYENNSIRLLDKPEKWSVTMVDTGLETMTGGRLKRIEKYIDGDTFMMTYGDGLSDINIAELVKFHSSSGKLATVTGIQRQSQFGILTVENGIATSFIEKSSLDGIINGGFFVLNKEVFNYITEGDSCIFEQSPMKNLVKEKQMAVYLHNGFWKAVDTYKDLLEANEKWECKK